MTIGFLLTRQTSVVITTAAYLIGEHIIKDCAIITLRGVGKAKVIISEFFNSPDVLMILRPPRPIGFPNLHVGSFPHTKKYAIWLRMFPRKQSVLCFSTYVMWSPSESLDCGSKVVAS